MPRLAASLAALLIAAAPALGFDTSGSAAIVVDHGTGTVLFEKNAEVPLPPASMSKLMTLYMLFEAIRDGRVTPESKFVVSNRAQALGGSRMFVEAGTAVPVIDLIRGIIVQSGNDACVVVAEGLAGSEEAFAAAMTKRARELGLENTVLKNASGWPADGHVMSVEDLAKLTRLIIGEFPEYYAIFDETEFTWNGITQANRNPLLGASVGADGLKTGHTEEAGYGFVGSAEQNGRRINFVITGLGSIQERRIETEQLVRWAFANFQPVHFFDAGETVGEAEVWMGTSYTVPLVAPRELAMLVPHDVRDSVTAAVAYRGPLDAPIAAGAPIADLVVTVPGGDTARFPLVAGADVERGGLMRRIEAGAWLARDRAVGLVTGSQGRGN